MLRQQHAGTGGGLSEEEADLSMRHSLVTTGD
jgi:hypothetical protein